MSNLASSPLQAPPENARGMARDWLQLPISIVSSATETKTYPTTVGEVLDGIRSGKWAMPVKRVRDGYKEAFKAAKEENSPDPAAIAKKKVHTKKQRLAAVTFSGSFSKRGDDAIESHSGLICADLDNLDDCNGIRARLTTDPFIQALFESPTGSGVKALVRINPTQIPTSKASRRRGNTSRTLME